MAKKNGRAYVAVNNYSLPKARNFYQTVKFFLKTRRKENNDKNWEVNAIQFKSSLSLTASESDVSELMVAEDDSVSEFKLTVHDFGLLGIHGTLPHSYTQWIEEQIHLYNDIAIKEFIDILNHRVNVLRFKLWKKTRLIVCRELDSDFSFPGVFNGMAGNFKKNIYIKPDNVTLWGRRTFANLTRLLQREFNCPIRITPFKGEWINVETSDLCILGNTSNTMGQGMILGNKYWDIHASFHVRIGPIDFGKKIDEKRKKLQEIIECYLHPFITFSSEFIIPVEKKASSLRNNPTLGFNCFLGDSNGIYTSIKFMMK
jgi:type VI secretion system protein ImpH